ARLSHRKLQAVTGDRGRHRGTDACRGREGADRAGREREGLRHLRAEASRAATTVTARAGRGMSAAAATTRTTPATPQARRLWIVDPWHDLALIVGAPAIILPAIWLLQARFQPNQIYLFVASFGAVGHHLPGMMRAYGDRYLFDRFKYRFVLTPLVL